MIESKVGFVIPAQNEEVYLPGVLETVCSVEWISQIVVVDDNSTDSTREIAIRRADQDPRMALVNLDSSSGKSSAMLAGTNALQDKIEYVIFTDADLIGMQLQHIEKLYAPIKSGECEMAVAVFRGGGLRTDAAQILTPNLSGQRCLKRSAAAQALQLLENRGYGVEIGLTVYARRSGWKILYIPWKGVTHLTQEYKHGIIPGLKARAAMYRQIIATWMWMRGEKGDASTLESVPEQATDV